MLVIFYSFPSFIGKYLNIVLGGQHGKWFQWKEKAQAEQEKIPFEEAQKETQKCVGKKLGHHKRLDAPVSLTPFLA
ncbi:MAG: hypothetical protein DCC43_01045 [Candidatus Brocadia sp.]|nr:hypothetical protein [Candidatus Brocadia sp. AMX3]RIK03165.1 MAG: hypothetical protein DCC43_01045 [Candidatus Brocadia sp.]